MGINPGQEPVILTRFSQKSTETAMTLTDPWTGDDDTDCGYYDTPFGNNWCPDDEPTSTAVMMSPARSMGPG